MDPADLLNNNNNNNNQTTDPEPASLAPQAIPEPIAPVEPAEPEPVVPVSDLPPIIPEVPEPVVEPVSPPVPTVPVEPAEPMAPEVPTPPVSPAAQTPISAPESAMTQPAVEPTAAAPIAAGGDVFEGIGSGKYKVVVLKDKCIGAASCIAVAPKSFELNDQQVVRILPTINTDTDENLLLAAQSCPTLAIEVYDTTTGEKIWPK